MSQERFVAVKSLERRYAQCAGEFVTAKSRSC